MEPWHFLTTHARVLLCIASDPRMRLREIATIVEITERSVSAIVGQLADAGIVLRQREGRRNRYVIRRHLPVPDPGLETHTIGDVLDSFLAAHPRGA
jgi:hypothetical protein